MSVSILCADCVDSIRLLADNSVDVAFFDPPYNTGNETDKRIHYDQNEDFAKKNWIPFHTEDGWDTIEEYQAWCNSWVRRMKKKLKPKGSMFICGSFHNIPDVALCLKGWDYYTIQWIQFCIPNAFPNLSMTKMINANQTLIWCRKDQKITHYYDKEAAKRYNDGKNLRDYWLDTRVWTQDDDTWHEFVDVTDAYFLINNDTQAGKLWKHPSKKPVTLVERAIDIAVPKSNDSLVFDCFAGSGTTGVAVTNLNKKYNLDMQCILSDSKKEYCDLMQQRLGYA